MRLPSRSWTLSVAALAIAVVPARAQAFTVRFSWAGIPACQAVSPAFELRDVPPGTKRLSFTMTDLDVPTFHHGGATIPYTGDAVERGAIRYIGPCPPAGQRHRYQWTVRALDAAGRILGSATATATFPP
ncbi:MAG: phospholipid-binding protein [Pseudolabrys sp.]|nr:phospholipid-binding protein [Pseudolabrys sp.]